MSQGPIAVTSRICITPVMGRRVRSPGESQLQGARTAPRANSSHPQPNCCEFQVASRNRLSRGGFRTKDLFFIILTHNGPLRSNLQIQVLQSLFYPFRSYLDSLSFISFPISAEMCEFSLGLILRNTVVLIWSFPKVCAIHVQIL